MVKCRYLWNTWADVPLHHMKVSPHQAKNVTKHIQPLIYVIIPGNPGCIQFYEKFAQVLCNSTNTPVWGISHTGHVRTDKNTDFEHPKVLDCGLDKQIEHKITYLEKEVFPNAEKVILIGHSIGCYIILHIMNRMKHQESSICKSILLFPTIERMKQSPKGKVFTPMLSNARWLFVFSVWILRFLPTSMVSWLISTITKCKEECIHQTIVNHFHTNVVDCSTYMGLHEMHEVNERDDEIIEQYIDKLLFYYGAQDEWCPISYYKDVKRKHGHHECSHIELCSQKFEHAFVMHRSAEVANLVAEWTSDFSSS